MSAEAPHSPTNVSPRRRLPRVSLAVFFLLVTVACLSLALFSNVRDKRNLQREVRVYRRELGMFAIEDRTKVHAMEVVAGGTCLWKWRVYFPPRHSFFIRHLKQDAPTSDQVDRWDGTSGPYPPGRYLITLALQPGSVGQWQCIIEHDASTMRQSSNLRGTLHWDAKRFGLPNSANAASNALRALVVQEVDEPLVLLRCRADPIAAEAQGANLPGFMLWLAPCEE